MDKLEEAMEYSKLAIKINPKYMGAYILHSKVMAYKNKLPAALDILKQALSKDKENK
jgi:tetratricopeptide (TPR) repeat protein